MAYTSIDNSGEFFESTLYTGNSTARTITTGMQADLFWIKGRNTTRPNCLFDTVLTNSFASGNSKYLVSSTDAGVTSNATDQITAVTSTGFTMGTDASSDQINGNGQTTVAWTWKAGNSSGSSNTAGSINSTVNVNTTSGFSIVRYTGNGSAGATIGHGIGAAPKLMIVKSDSDNYNWTIYYGDPTDYLVLNGTDTTTDSAEVWNDTAPSSTLFTVGNRNSTNQNSSTFIAYCFAEKQGFSKFGTYGGNGNNDGTFTYLGFKPNFLIVKRTDSGNSWYMYSENTSTTGGNLTDKYLEANESNTEATTTGEYGFDFYANGFKARGTGGGTNANNGNYIYMAFAEAPFVGSNNQPATAR